MTRDHTGPQTLDVTRAEQAKGKAVRFPEPPV